MKGRVLAAVLVSAAAAAASAARGAERDPKADAVGHALVAGMGGEGAWEKARQFQFDFVVVKEGKEVARFSHAWDRYTGDYRLQGVDKAGAPYAVYFNVNTKAGKAFVNGVAVEGAERDKRLESAYERFINDTYWLLAPWKIFDPGVHLALDGEKPCPGGGTCDVLRLSFENVGLTPKDVYWIWVARDGSRMIQWQYVLGGASEPPTTAQWKDWRKLGGVLLSLDKPITGEPFEIRFDKVAVAPARDDTLFRPPSGP
jgi:opacity protein-like surface antigen